MEIPDVMEVALFWKGMPIGKAQSECRMTYRDVYDITWHGECLGEPVEGKCTFDVFVAMGEVARKRGLKHVTFCEGYGVEELVVPKLEAATDGPIEGVDIDVEKVVREYMEDQGRL